MSFLTAQQIRSKFVDYFTKNDHQHINSSPLVPQNDPSLLFVNAGMVQFKDIFTGLETPSNKRVVTAQKCVRAGGKHNDLDNVGYTARHHTFFEMLGNFSFGDYFKEKAIFYAWEMLTRELEIDKNKLWITVYHEDREAFNLWKKITGFSDERIIKIKTNDNFWSMGDTGPCGPCSEIFYDHGDKVFGSPPGTEHEDGDRFVEIWNLVFMEFEQKKDGRRVALPHRSVDTGMGLERIAAVMQGVHNNYETDLFVQLIEAAESIVKVKATGDALFSYRIIADHLRSSSFLIADGVMPANEGRGYVLRRIMRRAMRHAHQLGAKEPLMHQLVPTLVGLFGQSHPEIDRAQSLIAHVLLQEEERFLQTLSKGLKLLDEESKTLKKGEELSGDLAFKLYDTYGFPLDLTQDILKKQQIKVDIAGFDQQMNIQKERARANWSGSNDKSDESVWFDLLNQHGASEFVGYACNDSDGKVLSLVENAKIVQKISIPGTEFTLISNQTPFYGESGGQVGDMGIISNDNCQIKVIDTQKFSGKLILHKCKLEQGVVQEGDEVSLQIDQDRRNNLRIHHTATHILHTVLRQKLGNHVVQKGSLVLPNKLRFDFSHTNGLSSDEISEIEYQINQIIQNNSDVVAKIMPSDQAIKGGAMALFGEKYDDEVRVISLGRGDYQDVSMELCGGTHVTRTGDIGAFKLMSEMGIAAGVRRIEAVCGRFAFAEFTRDKQIIEQLAATLKANKGELLDKIEQLVGANKSLTKQLEKEQMSKLSLTKEQVEQLAKPLDSGGRLVYQFLEGEINPKLVRSSAENLSKKYDDLIVTFAFISKDKLSLLVAISKPIGAKYNAKDIAAKIIEKTGGQGGGQPLIAQVGNIAPSKKGEIEKILHMSC